MSGENSNMPEKDEQREEQWNEINCKTTLRAKKLGYSTKEEYLKAKRRINRIEALQALGATKEQAVKEVNNAEKTEARQEKIDKDKKIKKTREFIARYLDETNIDKKIDMQLKEIFNKGMKK